MAAVRVSTCRLHQCPCQLTLCWLSFVADASIRHPQHRQSVATPLAVARQRRQKRLIDSKNTTVASCASLSEPRSNAAHGRVAPAGCPVRRIAACSSNLRHGTRSLQLIANTTQPLRAGTQRLTSRHVAARTTTNNSSGNTPTRTD